MRIENPEKIEKKGFLRLEDIDHGNCFTFLDDNELYMLTEYEKYVAVSTGELYEILETDENRPIREVPVKVTILESC